MHRLSIPDLLYEEGSFGVFLLVTVVLGGGGGVARPAAPSRRPGGRGGRSASYMLMLGGAVRFFHFALFDGTLLSLHYYVVDTAVCLAFGFARLSRRRGPRQMVTQYRWINEPAAAPMRWRRKSALT